MGLELKAVVPWGRSYDEYLRMFDLSKSDLQLRILGCGDGPAAFNADLTQRGGHCVSVDPLYAFSAEQIRTRINATYDEVMGQMHNQAQAFCWDVIRSVAELGDTRMAAMHRFLADYATGKQAGRYITGELPNLALDTGVFDLALCSHFLFLYSKQLSAEFHVRALQEMLRVAREVRVFPLLSLDGNLSEHLPALTQHFAQAGYCVGTRRVTYEFQKGGHTMMVINRRQ
jgi:SAM-dependent methyltransferase